MNEASVRQSKAEASVRCFDEMTSDNVMPILGNYPTIRLLKTTLFGHLYQGEKENREYAIKVSDLRQMQLRTGAADDPIREAQMIQKITETAVNVPMIRYVDDFFIDADNNKSDAEHATHHVLVTDFVRGTDLFDYVYSDRTISEEKIREPLFELCEFLHFLHTRVGVCHLDICLDNIMRCGDENQDAFTLKLCDFGMARIVDTISFSRVSSRAAYTAPEIYLARPFRGDLADVFSLGMTILFVITGIDIFGCLSKKCPVITSKIYQSSVVEKPMFFRRMLKHFKLDQHISVQLAHLLLCMICQVRQGRFTMEQVLQHPFFSEHGLLFKSEQDK